MHGDVQNDGQEQRQDEAQMQSCLLQENRQLGSRGYNRGLLEEATWLGPWSLLQQQREGVNYDVVEHHRGDDLVHFETSLEQARESAEAGATEKRANNDYRNLNEGGGLSHGALAPIGEHGARKDLALGA